LPDLIRKFDTKPTSLFMPVFCLVLFYWPTQNVLDQQSVLNTTYF